jgi:hypothetical protein
LTRAQQIEDLTLERDLTRLEEQLEREGLFQGIPVELRREETLRILLALAGRPIPGVEVARARRAVERAIRGEIL